jgi:hypothetical protein
MGVVLDLDNSSGNIIAPPLSPHENLSFLPPTSELLCSGGDPRIVRNSIDRLNKYGTSSVPDMKVLAYGSSTASSVSTAGFAAAERVRCRLLSAQGLEPQAITYAGEMARVRSELLGLCGLSDLIDLDVILSPSGTDLHLFAALLVGGSDTQPSLAIMIEGAETGSGIPLALSGQPFSDSAAFGSCVVSDDDTAIEVKAVAGREADGRPRAAADIDCEVESLIADAAASGRRVLLNVADVTKTGLIAPSPILALKLRRRFPEMVEVIVDACQFRISPPTIRAYLEHGFCVALTGSKFVTGPAFSGALLVPESVGRRLRTRPLPSMIKSYSARADWPSRWVARSVLAEVTNYGLLLRWESALEELRAFRSLPNADIVSFLEAFADAVRGRLATDMVFDTLPVPPLDRQQFGKSNSWDRIQTIFPFTLRCPRQETREKWLSRKITAQIYDLLRQDLSGHSLTPRDPVARKIVSRRCQIGQPIACGTREGTPVSALRLCVGMRLVVDAVGPHGRGPNVVIREAFSVLDKTAILAREMSMCSSKI